MAELQANNSKAQSLWRDVDVFYHMARLLTAEQRSPRLPHLMKEVLRTLICLMHDCPPNKEYFGANVGYEQLARLITQSILLEPSEAYSHQVLELLLLMVSALIVTSRRIWTNNCPSSPTIPRIDICQGKHTFAYRPQLGVYTQ